MNKKWFFIPLALLLLALAFLPQIASTKLGKPFFVKYIESKTGAHVTIDSQTLSWRGPQIFTKIQWVKEELNGHIEELRIMAPFWSFAGPFELEGGSIHYPGGSIESITARLNGKALDLHINGSDLTAQIRGQFLPNEFILTEPLDAKFRRIPFFNQLKLQNTASLRIEPEGFSFPLPYSLSKVDIGKATLDLGQASSPNTAQLDLILNLFNAPRGQNVDLWFTPVDASLLGGVLQMGRCDVLIAHSIHLCAWGRIHLADGRLDMTLGIPADTLKKSFKITNVSENYVLQVPLKGTLRKPEINKQSAAAKIAALVTAGQIPKKGVFGKAIDLFSKPPEDKSVPPPRRPFPWE